MTPLNLSGKELVAIVLEAVKEEFDSLKEDFTPEQQELLKKVVVGLAEERIALAVSESDEEKDQHRMNIAHVESAATAMLGIARIKAYDSTISVVGRILAAIAVATGKALV